MLQFVILIVAIILLFVTIGCASNKSDVSKSAYITVGIITLIIATALLTMLYFQCKYPKLYLEKAIIIGLVGIFLPSIIALLVTVFKLDEKKITSLCMFAFMGLSMIYFLISCIIIFLTPPFVSETTSIENYLQTDNIPTFLQETKRGDFRPLFPENIPDDAKSIVYHYRRMIDFPGSFYMYLEMELPPDLYENEKQRIMQLIPHDVEPIVEDDFVTIFVKPEDGAGGRFSYCDERMIVKYTTWISTYTG